MSQTGYQVSPEIVNEFRQRTQHVAQMRSKVVELDAQVQEYLAVELLLKDLEGGRRCYRLIGSVLAESTVGETLPQVSSQKDGIIAACDELSRQILEKEKTLKEMSEKYQIVARPTA